MKDEIMKRGMFSGPMSKDTMNSGIMAGFADEEDMVGEEEEGMGDDYEADEGMAPMVRNPQNPEILMNNLRGDMRSVDARYLELAQMVGQEAADQTPPEVLAMLMGQIGQQEGIGALPQAEGMQPPPMPGDAPMGAPAGMEGMPSPDQMQGAPQMPPPGMEGMPPFPQGGAEQAPPTPDGMPPQMAAVGGLMSAAQRMSQFAGRGADAVGRGASAANQYLGNALMSPQPTLQRMVGPSGMPLTVQGRESLVQGASGAISPGMGTQLAPYASMGPLTAPSLTQGMGAALAQGAERFPRAAQALQKMFPAAAFGMGALGAAASRPDSAPVDEADEARRQALIEQIPTTSPMGAPPEQAAPSFMAPAPVDAAPAPSAPEPVFAPEQEPADTAAFIKSAMKEKSKSDRIREGAAEYTPLFQELLGEDKDSAKTNALLLLAEAGFKLAGSTKPTFAMAVGEAAAGIPRGFAAIVAQGKDRDVKIKTAALEKAITDVDEQDKYAQALKLQMLKGDYDLLKEQAKKGGIVVEDGGAGARLSKDKNGSFLGVSIDPEDPTVKSAVGSRFTLRDTDNPFVENRGPAPTSVETDKAERINLTGALRALDGSLSTLENLKGAYTSAYSPGTWFTDKVNNLIVPVSGGLVRPDVDLSDKSLQLKTGLNTIMKNIASANNSGRIAVQEQEWVRENNKALADPTAFFQNKELAAKGFASLETILRNSRQQLLTQLGYEGSDYVMSTPNTGTQSDPFILGADPGEQKRMFTFLSSTIGKIQDPKATVYLRMPNGRIDAFSPAQLRGTIGK